jgi:hypothetical protein
LWSVFPFVDQEPVLSFLILLASARLSFKENTVLNPFRITAVRKVTFDCRSDSEALLHQYGVHLSMSNYLDSRVFQQGIKINNGTYFPSSMGLNSLRFICGGYFAKVQWDTLFEGEGPHHCNNNVWRDRLLSNNSLHSMCGLELSARSESDACRFRDEVDPDPNTDRREVLPI